MKKTCYFPFNVCFFKIYFFHLEINHFLIKSVAFAGVFIKPQ